MAWRRIGNKPLSEPMLTQFIDAYKVLGGDELILPHCKVAELILGLRPANERRRYFVTTSLIGWAQT